MSEKLIISVVFLLFGMAALYGSYRKWKVKQIFKDTPREKVRSVSQGRSKLIGKAAPFQGKTIKAPILNKDCLFYKMEVQEWEEDHNDDHGVNSGHWETIAEERDGHKFFLEDDTGRILVHPKNSELKWKGGEEHGKASRKETVSPEDDSVPEVFQKHVDDSLLPDFMDREKLRVKVTALLPNEDLVILGIVGNRPDSSGSSNEANAMVGGTEEDLYIISNKSNEELQSGIIDVLVLLLVGAAATIIGGTIFIMNFVL